MPIVSADTQLRDILTRYRRIAIVGLSGNPTRPSFGVAAYLQRQGYDVWPVNPTLVGSRVLGRQVFGGLRDLPVEPEIVEVFRRSEYVAGVVDAAIAVGAKVLWTQLGVRDDMAAERASEAGLLVVQDRCMAIEHSRLRVGPVAREPFL